MCFDIVGEQIQKEFMVECIRDVRRNDLLYTCVLRLTCFIIHEYDTAKLRD